MSKEAMNEKQRKERQPLDSVSRREMLLTGTSVLAATGLASPSLISPAEAQQKKPAAQQKPATQPASAAQTGQKPNILAIWGDDIGMWNISYNNRGMMGYRTPNIDRIANEGLSFTDYCAQ